MPDSDAQPPTPSSLAPTAHSPRGPGAQHVRAPEHRTEASATGGDIDTATDPGATESPDEHRVEQPSIGTHAEEPPEEPSADASGPPGVPDRSPGRSRSSAEDSPPPPARAGHEAHPESGVRPTPPILSTSRSARVRSTPEVSAEIPPPDASDVPRREDTSISAGHEPGVRRDGPRTSPTTENREPGPERPTEDSPDAYDSTETPARDYPERPESVEPGGSSSYSMRENAFDEPTIRVTIGRIEVRAVSPPEPPPRRTKQPC
jgi:hypothetical protein